MLTVNPHPRSPSEHAVVDEERWLRSALLAQLGHLNTARRSTQHRMIAPSKSIPAEWRMCKETLKYLDQSSFSSLLLGSNSKNTMGVNLYHSIKLSFSSLSRSSFSSFLSTRFVLPRPRAERSVGPVLRRVLLRLRGQLPYAGGRRSDGPQVP